MNYATSRVNGNFVEVRMNGRLLADAGFTEERARDFGEMVRRFNAHEELLAAAKHALGFFERVDDDGTTMAGGSCATALRAAIAKAEGVR